MDNMYKINVNNIVQYIQATVTYQLTTYQPHTNKCTIQKTTKINYSDNNKYTINNVYQNNKYLKTTFACNNNNPYTINSYLPSKNYIFELINKYKSNYNKTTNTNYNPKTTQNYNNNKTQTYYTNYL